MSGPPDRGAGAAKPATNLTLEAISHPVRGFLSRNRVRNGCNRAGSGERRRHALPVDRQLLRRGGDGASIEREAEAAHD